MNRVARLILQDKLGRREDWRNDRERDREDTARGRDMERDRERDMERDRRSDRERGFEYFDDHDDFEDGARRRSKTTGRFMRDRGEMPRLTKHDLMHWEKILRNADGTRGKHFSMSDAEEAASKLGIRFDEYSEKEFCMVMNMLYSDFCEVFRSYITPEKEAHYYAKFAQAWLEDDDGPIGSEKLALYFYCIVDDE